MEQVLECVKRGAVTDHEHRLSGERRDGFHEPRPDPRDDIAIALTVGERSVDVNGAVRLDRPSEFSRAGAVVTLTKASIPHNRNATRSEGDLRRPDGADQIGTEHRGEIVSPAPLAEIAGLRFADGRQRRVEPARGQPGFVVDARRMRFEQDDEIRIPLRP